MIDKDFKPYQRVREIVGIIIMLAIGVIHGFRIGSYLNGDLSLYYYSYASDLLLPFGASREFR